MRIEEGQQKKEKYYGVSNLMKRRAFIDLEEISEDSNISIESINDIKVENSIDEISEGETVIEQLLEEEKMEIGDLDDEILDHRKLDAQKVLASEVFRTKKPEVEPIMVSSGAAKSTKVTKNILTIKVNFSFRFIESL